MQGLPEDYEERLYAGVLGKIIGVYLGRPFEGWTYERITEQLGDINYYVHEILDKPLIVTDDDISGTFTFVRALADYGYSPQITPAQIGQTWLNYIIEERTILWWGGMGNSTEHTAYLRLKSGVQAPESGSASLNGRVVAEQIGAQIFIDGWAMVAPGDPSFAADLARRAASVSHDGEAIYGSQVLAAMESQAFVDSDLQSLLDVGLGVIPTDSLIYRLISELRALRERESDWREARAWLAREYGYDKYGGGVHMIPNHGLVILSLLYGEDDFQRTQMIVNTSGWDTDCNAGNVGCLMGIKNGLSGLDAGPDYRTPVADRLYLPTADAGRAITDALIETYHLVNSARGLRGLPSIAPKNGARFHFSLPGARQGFCADQATDARGTVRVENVAGHSRLGKRSLALRYAGVAIGRSARVGTATFLTPEDAEMPGYGLLCSPTLYRGQTVTARVQADEANHRPVLCNLYARAHQDDGARAIVRGPGKLLGAGQAADLSWRLVDVGSGPISEVGVELRSDRRADGTVYLDYLTWNGTPDTTLIGADHGGAIAQRTWVSSADHVWTGAGVRLSQDRGTGLLIQGTRDWADYELSAVIKVHLARRAGLAVRVQGQTRFYGFLLCSDQTVQLVKALDGEHLLATASFAWRLDVAYELRLRVQDDTITGYIDGREVIAAKDVSHPLTGGAVALVCEEGRVDVPNVRITPIG
jgi:ADP-ribosylglycohydrolase